MTDMKLNFENRETIFDLLTCLSGHDEAFVQDVMAIVCDMISGLGVDIDEAHRTLEKHRTA